MAHPIRPASYIEINNFYTVTVYEKGAEVVRMQANLLGPEAFRKATDLYFERHDGQAVTTEDFVRCMADASGRDLSQLQHWYDYAGTPLLRVHGEYDAAAATYTLDIYQSVPDTPGQTDKPPFLIPIVTALVGADGQDLAVRLDARAGNAAHAAADRIEPAFRVSRRARTSRCRRCCAGSVRRSNSSSTTATSS